MPQVELFYSQSTLGHFTIILHDKTELLVHRIHFVDRGATAAHQGGKVAWAMHKIAQVSGYATGEVLSDFKSSPHQFQNRVNYGAANRPRINHWNINVPQMDQMLNWVHAQVQQQAGGTYPNYGYVIYSDNVDNCGSFAIKCLEQAGINITLPYLKSWLPFPSLIRDNV